MPNRARRRAGAARNEGRTRSRELAQRAGIVLRDNRRARGLTQRQASDRAGVSQGFWSLLERGGGTTASLETLAACAAAIGGRWTAFLEAAPGTDLPRDIVHLRGQQTIIAFAKPGGWRARVEAGIDPLARRSRAIDVCLDRASSAEIAVVELFDFIADGGDAMRGLADKVAAVRVGTNTDARIQGLFVLRATRRNRELVGRLGDVIRSRFPGSSAAWVAALSRLDRPMPQADGLIWVSVDGARLFPARLG